VDFSGIGMSYFDRFLPAFFAFLAARARARIFFITRRSAADMRMAVTLQKDLQKIN
jgi:hypothetical protein